MHFGIPEEITEVAYHFPIHPHLEGLEYVLVESKVWVDVGRDDLVPHEYRSWYHHYHDGRRESPIAEGDVPLYVLKAAFGLGTANPKNGSVVDAKDPKLEGDPESPVYSVEGVNWSEEEGEIVEQEEGPEDNQEWEWLKVEELEEEDYLLEDPDEEPHEKDSEEEDDPEEDPEYDPDEN
ncbi:hypothetical protein ACJRO7_023431 [Eucalyptus globulus]|uniref:Uncharacterized protein n=1 Tax=Eucalyptus globulus TaxID=34317 RepID=A0ABD3K8N6_EUCGL